MCGNRLYPDCLNPEDCESKSSNWVKVTERFKDSATKHHEKIIQKMNYLIPSGEHAEQRMSAEQRMISSQDVRDVIEFGEAICSRRTSDGSIKLIISGYYKFGKTYLPLHVPLIRQWNENGEEVWIVKTVYNPIEEVWVDNFSRKVCFCGKRRFGGDL